MKSLQRRTSALIFLGFSLMLFLGFNLRTLKDRYVFPKISNFPPIKEPRRNLTTTSGVELGRYLFYDPVLSTSGKMSCSTCHRQEYAFSYTLDYRTGSTDYIELQGKREIMPLFNLGWHVSFFWDCRVRTLEEQIFHPIRNKHEMNMDMKTATERLNEKSFYKKKFFEAFGTANADSVLISRAIAQFIRTILSYNSKFDRVMRKEAVFTKEELEGYELMKNPKKGNCFNCHTTNVNSSNLQNSLANNGLDDNWGSGKKNDLGFSEFTKKEQDLGRFKIPSLRNLAYTEPYMHDGRFEYLENVVDFYSERVKYTNKTDLRMGKGLSQGPKFTKDEKRKIIKFLMTLNDSAFINDKRYSNPFLQ